MLSTVPPPSRATTLPAPPLKPCGCGRSYDAFEWSRLPYVGVMGDEVETLELRNCVACNSTLAVVVSC